MLGEINRNLEPIEYEIILCKRDGTQIGVVKDYSDLSYTARFTGVEELSFKVPYYIMDRDFNQVKNPMFDKIKGDFYLLLNNEEYFWIDKPELKGDDKSLTKIIHAYSIEYLLQKKKVRNYTYNSRVLYSFDGEESDGMPLGIMNYLLTLTTWTMGYVDPELTALATRKYRSFDIEEASFYDVLMTIQNTFDCIIIFDRLNKQFNFYKTDHIGINRGLYVSEENYIKTFKQTINHDEIITKLYCYGKDNLTFEAVNPTGQIYVEDYTYLKTTDYMSQGLIDALNAYEELCQSHSGEFAEYLLQLSEYQTQLLSLQTELTALKTEKKLIEDSIDIKITRGEDYSDLNSQLEAKNVEIAAKESDIATIQSNINSVNANITNLKSLLSKKNNFTPEQLSELDDCTYEGTWTDTNYITAEDLYEDGLKALAEKSSPPLDFTVDVVNFLNVVECQHDWDKLVLGDKVYIHYDEFDVDLEVRLLAYTHQPQSNSLQLTFSNKNTLKTDEVTNIMKQAAGTTSTVEINKEHWKYSYNKTTEIDNVLNNEWDAALRQIVAGSNQDVKITERGIILTDADNPLFQMRILSNVIAISQDGFKTSKLAISPMGVYAEELIGELVASERLIITNEAGNFLVDDLGVTIQDMNLTILTSDDLARILLNSSVGLKVQRKINGEFVDTFFLDTNGKVNLRDGEIVISDTGDALTATNVWVWDKNGLRFSTNGFYGPFNSAWTIDGTLDMQAINVINLTASLIKGGVLKLGGENNVNGAAEIYDANDNLIGSIGKEGFEYSAETIIVAPVVSTETLCGTQIYSGYKPSDPSKITPNTIAEKLAAVLFKADNANNEVISKVSKGDYETFVSQTAEAISQKVSKGDIVSEINQSAEEVRIAANKISLLGFTQINDFTIDTNGKVTMNGDIHARNFSVDDNIYIIESGSLHSGILWCKNVNEFDQDTMPFIWGDCDEPNLDLRAGPTDLLMDSKGAQLAYRPTDSVLLADKNSSYIKYKDRKITLNDYGITIGDGSWSSQGYTSIYGFDTLKFSAYNAYSAAELYLYIAENEAGFYPLASKPCYLGRASNKWEAVFANTGTIITSDREKKSDINYDMSQYEQLFPLLKPCSYKMNDGTSDRTHTGFISQDFEDALTTLNMDSKAFAAFIKSPRYVKDVDGNPTETIDGYDYAIRYEELIALNTHMIQKLMDRMDEVEAKLNGQKAS